MPKTPTAGKKRKAASEAGSPTPSTRKPLALMPAEDLATMIREHPGMVYSLSIVVFVLTKKNCSFIQTIHCS